MKLFASSACAWAPGVSTPAGSTDRWQLWKDGLVKITDDKLSPKLEFTDALFRRRLSQLTKMTIQVLHDVLAHRADCTGCKVAFVSLRGEIARELSVNQMLFEDKAILPAAFSLSVFNASPAAATIALGLHGGYTAIFPSQGSFRAALLAACAPVCSHDEEKLLFVYADEKIPDCYASLAPRDALPLSFATVLSAQGGEGSVELDTDNLPGTPETFLRMII